MTLHDTTDGRSEAGPHVQQSWTKTGSFEGLEELSVCVCVLVCVSVCIFFSLL
jgi:hypothetical protein